MTKQNNKLGTLRKEVADSVERYSEEFWKTIKSSGVPISEKKIGIEEFKAATNTILDGWWTDGPYAREFEKMLCKYIGVKHASFINSGSSANLLAISSLTSVKLEERRLKKGDEVITTACGFPTTINPIVQNSLIPVFCDINLGTYNIDIEDFKKAVTNKTKCVFLAHTLGNPFDVKAVKDICDDKNIWLIEDCCDALGSTYGGKKVGVFGQLSTLSFYPAHHITTIEGGAVLTNNNLLNDIVRSLRDWGRDCKCPTGKDNLCGKRFDMQMGDLPKGYDHKYIYSEIGYNLKSTDINAAIGIEQLKKIDEFNKIRDRNFKVLMDRLKQFEDIFLLPKNQKNSKPSWFGFVITLKDSCKFNRREILKYLDKKKIGTRLLFGGNITKQPYFVENKIKYRIVGNLKKTDYVMNNTFWVGVQPNVTIEMIDYIEKVFRKFLEKNH